MNGEIAMLLPIVYYGHPALRQKGARIDEVTPEIRQLARDMIQTMHAAAGVGLAAQQVARALQLTVLDIRGVTERPSTLEVAGETLAPETWMPLVLINPVITPQGDPESGPEGCLSFPEIYADIVRPGQTHVCALNDQGETLDFRCSGLLSRAVQHEYDHLQGILFIDRMSADVRRALRPELDALQTNTKVALKRSAALTAF